VGSRLVKGARDVARTVRQNIVAMNLRGSGLNGSAISVAAYSGRISINTPNTPFFAMIAVVIRCGRYRQLKSGWREERKMTKKDMDRIRKSNERMRTAVKKIGIEFGKLSEDIVDYCALNYIMAAIRHYEKCPRRRGVK